MRLKKELPSHLKIKKKHVVNRRKGNLLRMYTEEQQDFEKKKKESKSKKTKKIPVLKTTKRISINMSDQKERPEKL